MTIPWPGGPWRGGLACALYRQETVVRAAVEALSEILTEKIDWQDGYVIVPDRPGIGFEIDEAVALAHPYHDTRLHLNMHEDRA